MRDPRQNRPRFDVGFFLKNAEEPGLGEAETAECRRLWAHWSGRLCSTVAATREGGVLAVWLGREVEEEVDAAWEKSPSHGYLLNALALTLCMCAVREHIPELEDAGCAPAPRPTPELADALTGAGLPTRAGTGLELARRYAVATPFPFTERCAACFLLPACPAKKETRGRNA